MRINLNLRPHIPFKSKLIYILLGVLVYFLFNSNVFALNLIDETTNTYQKESIQTCRNNMNQSTGRYPHLDYFITGRYYGTYPNLGTPAFCEQSVDLDTFPDLQGDAIVESLFERGYTYVVYEIQDYFDENNSIGATSYSIAFFNQEPTFIKEEFTYNHQPLSSNRLEYHTTYRVSPRYLNDYVVLNLSSPIINHNEQRELWYFYEKSSNVSYATQPLNSSLYILDNVNVYDTSTGLLWDTDGSPGNYSIKSSTMIANFNMRLDNGTSIGARTDIIVERSEPEDNSVLGWLDRIFSGIGDIIISLGRKIAEVGSTIISGITNFLHDFFVPDNSQFQDFIQDEYDYLQTKLGFMFYPITLITDFASRVYSLNNSTSAIFTIPNVDFMGTRLVNTTSINLMDIVNQNQAFSYLYQIYRVVVSALIVFWLANLAYRKFNETFGGGYK